VRGWCVLFTSTAVASTLITTITNNTDEREREGEGEGGGGKRARGSCRIKYSGVVVKTEMAVMKAAVMEVLMAVVTSVGGVEVAMKGGGSGDGGGWRSWR
jgi:hypothetical protein